MDDTDIINLDMEKDPTVNEAHQALQVSLESWSQLITTTGGSLKPEKCFYYLISFQWDKDGKWSYARNKNNLELDNGVHLPYREVAAIKHLSLDTAKVTLVTSSCTSGNSKASLTTTDTKAADWGNTA